MAEYTGGSGEKRQYEDKFSIMHYNDKTQEYKVLSINLLLTDKDGNPLEDSKKGIFLGIRIGTKGQTPTKLTLMLNPQEIAYLTMSLQKIFNELQK